jgi:hypothetical protein
MFKRGRKSLCPDPCMSKLGFETIFVKSTGFVNGMVSGTKQTALLRSRPSKTVESIHSSQGQRLVEDGFTRVSLCAGYQGSGHERLHMHVLYWRKYPWIEKLEKLARMTGRM